MNDKTMWMVRAGQHAHLYNEFKEKGIVAIGWNDVGDLSQITNPDQIKNVVRKTYSDYKPGKKYITAGQLIRFKLNFKLGDYVITYNPEDREYLIGEIISDYMYDPKFEKHHIRKVKWLGNIPRDLLSTSTKNTLGAISTLFEVNESAKNEILAILKNEKQFNENMEEEELLLETIKEELIAKAHEFIKDKLLKLNWEEMEELVAGLLRGMGYKTMMTSKGADRGRDIYASPDGLGLEEPRIVVEVKHRSGQVSAKEMRSFIGGLRQGVKGVYVSTGGFSKEAKYEAERSNIPVTLIDLDLLATLITQYYDKFDEEAKSLIPLIKIFWPV